METIVLCIRCKKPFEQKTSRQKYCSPNCSHESFVKKDRKINPAKYARRDRNWTQQPDRAALSKRLHNVVLLAGYTAGYADKVVAEYLDSYMQDMPQFLRMMDAYEQRYKEDGEII